MNRGRPRLYPRRSVKLRLSLPTEVFQWLKKRGRSHVLSPSQMARELIINVKRSEDNRATR